MHAKEIFLPFKEIAWLQTLKRSVVPSGWFRSITSAHWKGVFLKSLLATNVRVELRDPLIQLRVNIKLRGLKLLNGLRPGLLPEWMRRSRYGMCHSNVFEAVISLIISPLLQTPFTVQVRERDDPGETVGGSCFSKCMNSIPVPAFKSWIN